MERYYKNKLLLLKYHNEKACHGPREKIAILGEVFEMLEAAGYQVS